MERWLSGRKRAPAKCVYSEKGIEGSNPSLSTIRLRANKNMYIHGEMAERLNAAVLKTVMLKGIGGSNPSLSTSFPLCKYEVHYKKNYDCNRNSIKKSFFFSLATLGLLIIRGYSAASMNEVQLQAIALNNQLIV